LRDKGEETAHIVLDVVHHYSIKIINTISDHIFHEAARLKAAHKMSIADSIGLATSLELSSQFVTSDHHEMDEVDLHKMAQIYWIR